MSRASAQIPTLSDELVFNLDATLATIIAQGVRVLRARDVGHPASLTRAEWQRILNDIAEGFEQYVSSPDEEALDRSFVLLRRWFRGLWD